MLSRTFYRLVIGSLIAYGTAMTVLVWLQAALIERLQTPSVPSSGPTRGVERGVTAYSVTDGAGDFV